LRREVAIAARTRAKVLILGETGSGKEVVARSIHEQSARAGRAFMAVNCSGIPETLLESELFGHTRGSFTGAYRDKPGMIRQAHGGTLFLDELGEMSLRMQAALLRFTETGEIHTVGADTAPVRSDVRLIAATNRDLRARIAEGAFREDLYYRLNVILIRVAPLRERPDDVPVLFAHYTRLASEAYGMPTPELTADAAEALRAYAWPGNVRELRNVAERLAIAHLGRAVTPADLPIDRPMTAAPAVPSLPPAASRGADAPPSPVVDTLFERFAAGETFWTAVREPFIARGLTRQDLSNLIDAGLQQTNGSYRALLAVFNLPPTDYKRFHAFLYQQQCNLPVAPYRRPRRTTTFTLVTSERPSAVA
jgi:DNA-binding NtrC family response regulator